LIDGEDDLTFSNQSSFVQKKQPTVAPALLILHYPSSCKDHVTHWQNGRINIHEKNFRHGVVRKPVGIKTNVFY